MEALSDVQGEDLVRLSAKCLAGVTDPGANGLLWNVCWANVVVASRVRVTMY